MHAESVQEQLLLDKKGVPLGAVQATKIWRDWQMVHTQARHFSKK